MLMKIRPVSKVAVCTTVRFAASGWIFCPRFARAPSDVGVSTASVASTNLEQNLSAIIPQTGEISGLVVGACARAINQGLQFTGLIELNNYVATANKLASDIELRKGGPVGVVRQAGANL